MAMREVILPTGGRAWVRTRLSHERDAVYNAVIVGLSTLSARAAMLNAQANAGELTEATTTEIRAISSQVSSAKAELLELGTHRWEGVRDPDNPDTELTFPADIGKLDREDFEVLFVGVLAGIKEGSADPKGSPPPSDSTSPSMTTPGPETPQPI